MGAMVAKMFIGMFVKMLTESFLQDMFIFGAESLAKSTKTDVDDKLVAIIKGHLSKPDESVNP